MLILSPLFEVNEQLATLMKSRHCSSLSLPREHLCSAQQKCCQLSLKYRAQQRLQEQAGTDPTLNILPKAPEEQIQETH